MNKCIKCGSYAFNLYKEDIDQGGLCDVHYWQGRAHRAEALAEQPAQQQEQVAWVPYLSDRADGVSGHYAIARWNPRGYREVWNLRRHAWGAYSDDVLSLEEADTLLRLIEIPTLKVETPQPTQQEPVAWLKVIETPGGWGKFVEAKPHEKGAKPVYTSPQPAQRTWVGLTDEEIMDMYNEPRSDAEMIAFGREVEAKLKEKNNG